MLRLPGSARNSSADCRGRPNPLISIATWASPGWMHRASPGQRVSAVTRTKVTFTRPTPSVAPGDTVTTAGSVGAVGEDEHAIVDNARIALNRNENVERIS